MMNNFLLCLKDHDMADKASWSVSIAKSEANDHTVQQVAKHTVIHLSD